MTAADTSGQQRVCLRCIERQRQIVALRLEIERRSREMALVADEQRKVFVAVLALVGGATIAIFALWLIGRLAVAIGGAT